MNSQSKPTSSFTPIDNPMIRFNSSGYQTKGGAFYTPQQAHTFVGNLPAFPEWFAKMVHVYGDDFRSVHIVSIYPFVDENTPLGIVCVDADVWRNGMPVPGGAILRGGSVAVLLILVALENSQRRFIGEILDETSITIHQDECISLGSFVSSSGSCDKEIEVVRVVKIMPLMEILALKSRQEEIRKEEDYIRDIKENRIKDGKALASLALHLLNPLILD